MHTAVVFLATALPATAAEPIARAGRTFLAYPGESIRLDGSASEGDAPEYRWVQVGGPRVPLTHADTVRPEFYTFELTIRDGSTASPPDEVDVVVLDPEIGTRYAPTAGCSTVPSGAGTWFLLALPLLVVPCRSRRPEAD
jgi:hypothetical protein